MPPAFSASPQRHVKSFCGRFMNWALALAGSRHAASSAAAAVENRSIIALAPFGSWVVPFPPYRRRGVLASTRGSRSWSAVRFLLGGTADVERSAPLSRDSQPSERRPPRPAEGKGTKTTRPEMPPRNAWLWFIVILALNFLLVRIFFPAADEALTVPYTVFKEEVRKDNVAAIFSQGERIEGRFVEPVTFPRVVGDAAEGTAAPRTGTTFTTTLPSFVDPGLENLLIEHGVEISAEPIRTGSGWPLLVFGFGPALLIILFYVWLFRRAARQGGGLMGIGRSKAKRYDVERDTRVTFDDVAGIDEVENELAEIVDFLKNPEKYTRLGGTAPKGVLLVGAPGTGKTLLARAVAGEAGVPFFSMSAAEFVEMIVGVGAARVRDLF